MDINQEIRKIIDRCDSQGFPIVLKECFQTVSKTKEIVNGGIVYDGVVNANRFSGIVFLLKEATMAGTTKFGENWSLAETTFKEANGQEGKTPEHWRELCYWTEALKNPEKPYKAAEKCGGNLAEIALINIKKTAGEGTSDGAPLDIIAKDEEYSQIIRDEINAIKKVGKISLVICGGTFDLAKKIYKVNTRKKEVSSMDCGAEYFVKDDVVFLSFVHPSVRCGKEVAYAYAQVVFSEAKQKKLF